MPFQEFSKTFTFAKRTKIRENRESVCSRKFVRLKYMSTKFYTFFEGNIKLFQEIFNTTHSSHFVQNVFLKKKKKKIIYQINKLVISFRIFDSERYISYTHWFLNIYRDIFYISVKIHSSRYSISFNFFKNKIVEKFVQKKKIRIRDKN